MALTDQDIMQNRLIPYFSEYAAYDTINRDLIHILDKVGGTPMCPAAEDDSEQSKILQRLSYYNQKIIEKNNNFSKIFKNIYYYLLIAFIVIIIIKRDKNLYNLYFVLLAFFIPFVLALILYALYGVRSNILSFIL